MEGPPSLRSGGSFPHCQRSGAPAVGHRQERNEHGVSVCTKPKESDKPFAGYSMYLGLEPERSLVTTAVRLGKRERRSVIRELRFPTRHEMGAPKWAIASRNVGANGRELNQEGKVTA